MSQEIINQFWSIIEGCTKHMTYRGKAAPKHDCPSCRQLFEMRMILERDVPKRPLEAARPMLFNVLCRLCVEGIPHQESEHMREITSQRRGNP